MAGSTNHKRLYIGTCVRAGTRSYHGAIFAWPITNQSAPVGVCVHKHRSRKAAIACARAVMQEVGQEETTLPATQWRKR